MSADTTQKFVHPKRWSATRKMEIVLRHIRGESLDSLSREIGIAASQIEMWHQKVIQEMELSLKDREQCTATPKKGGEHLPGMFYHVTLKGFQREMLNLQKTSC